MSKNKEHPLAHILRAIADGVPVQGKWGVGDWWDFDPSKHAFDSSSFLSWRIKPKPKVKKWRWVIADLCGNLMITAGHYSSEEEMSGRTAIVVKAVQKIESTMIEVEAD